MATSYTFTDVIAREPGDSVIQGLRDGDGPNPDAGAFRQQHTDYLSVLRDVGVNTLVLPVLEAFPDSVFVEDAALVFGDTAIALRPGAPTRQGEVAALLPTLQSEFKRVLSLADIDPDACVDGGDILIAEQDVFAGESARTNRKGIEILSALLTELGYRLRAVNTPASILHFKTACGLLDEETVFATRALAATGCFSGYKVIEAVDDEEAAANLVRMNDWVLVASGYPATCELLEREGYRVRTVDISEAARIDGGLSCMSLRFDRGYTPRPRVL
ncbi:MAG: dimethylarginine dimethylaminohydrolase [Gammaproteobacteria bacterium]|nr:dimethylarginine dimethylaminohydrolase [Gammaproteobacteria bacterium]